MGFSTVTLDNRYTHVRFSKHTLVIIYRSYHPMLNIYKYLHAWNNVGIIYTPM